MAELAEVIPGRPPWWKADEQQAFDAQCPNAAEHTTEGYGRSYTGWHEWARAKGRTHRNVRCQGCGYYLIWRRKGGGRG